MTLALTILFALLFLPLIIGWGLWLFFALLAALPARTRATLPQAENIRIDLLIPAHDEETLLPRLLETLHRQTGLKHIGRTLVIADHCTDRTAALARQGHADVLERNTGPRGKPAALRDGIAWLNSQANAGAAVMILDADCTVSPNLIEQCAAALEAGAQVVQAAYVLDENHSMRGSQRLHAPATIAFGLKNFIRPKGMARVHVPTQLFGTGMCFRADVLDKIHFADHLTEDLAISHDLLLAGVSPRFVWQAEVRSPLPTETSAMTTQKLRWETGQVQTWSKLPAILIRLLRHRRPGWLGAAVALIDWSAPPLAMAVLYWLGVTFALVFTVAMRWVSPWVLILSAETIASLVAYVVIGGVQISGAAAVGRLMLSVPRFLFWKIRLYGQMLAGRGPRSWQRTPRGVAAASGGRTP